MGLLNWLRGENPSNDESKGSHELMKLLADFDDRTPISQCQERGLVKVVGIVELTWSRKSPTERFEALLRDDTGKLRLVWLGRSQIPGIKKGQILSVEGTVGKNLFHTPDVVVSAVNEGETLSEAFQECQLWIIDPRYSIQVIED